MPTFVHSINATLSVGGTALEGTLESADMSLTRLLAEIKAFAAGQVDRVMGLKDCSFKAGGAHDATIDAALFAAWDGAAPVAVIFSPDGTTTYTANAIIATYSISAGGDAVKYTVDFAGAGDVARA
jgi:hypothetical protein